LGGVSLAQSRGFEPRWPSIEDEVEPSLRQRAHPSSPSPDSSTISPDVRAPGLLFARDPLRVRKSGDGLKRQPFHGRYAEDPRELNEQIVGLGRAVIDYHTSVI